MRRSRVDPCSWADEDFRADCDVDEDRKAIALKPHRAKANAFALEMGSLMAEAIAKEPVRMTAEERLDTLSGTDDPAKHRGTRGIADELRRYRSPMNRVNRDVRLRALRALPAAPPRVAPPGWGIE
ncbi:hypothetical protein [Muricoccus radiodurans]|uniref:hypothetical protein n=1 Tax=Muricoccus radiodurans TaxID=2231721 RepID=UPI003CE7A02D